MTIKGYICLLLFFIGFLCSCKMGEKESLVDLERLFQKGDFCQLNKEIATYKAQLIKGDLEWQKLKLLEAKTDLELEKWSKVESNLKDLLPLAKEQQQTYNLLKARLAEKKENNVLADSLYQLVIANLDTNAKGKTEALAHYGIFLFVMDRFTEAEQTLKLATKNKVSPTSMLGKAYISLGTIYNYQSKTILAEETFQKAKTIWEDNNWTAHPHYALFLNDYALLKFDVGKPEKADSLVLLSEQINQANCPIPSIKGYNLSAKGNIKKQLGQYDEATEYLTEAIQIFDDLNLHKEIAFALVKLGEINYELEDYLKADSCFELSLTYINTFFQGEISFIAADPLQNLAESASAEENFVKSDSLFSIAVKMIEEKLGKRNSYYSTTISNWGIAKEYFEEAYDNAIENYKLTENLDTLLFSKEHPNYLKTLFNLARVYTKVDSINLANEYYLKANDLRTSRLENYFINFEESTRLAYRLEIMRDFDEFYKYACESQQSELWSELGRINLSLKNRALDYSIQTLNVLRHSATKVQEKLFNQWIEQRKIYSSLMLKSTTELTDLGISLDSVKKEKEALEKSLVRAIKGEQTFTQKDIGVSDLLNKLEADEVAIDFFNLYEFVDNQSKDLKIPYYALIYKKGYDHPKLIELPTNQALKKILQTSSHYTINAEVNYLLYQKIWQPLIPHLEGVQKIHLSPDGYLHQISFAGLISTPDAKRTLLDEYEIHYYSNLSDVVQDKKEFNPEPSILLVGNPDYDGQQREEWGKGFPFIELLGTSKEVEEIAAIMEQQNFKVYEYQKDQASEAAFRQKTASSPPSIIHLATHGYFYQKDTSTAAITTLEQRIKTSENALLRSGLVFADVNNSWLTNTSKKEATNDGILNALEVANLDLSQTDLVVLSACDTGKGDIIDGEGVFGLQRAFKMAGVSNLLISLWKVPDSVTAELMSHFYQNLSLDQNPQQALLQAQKAMYAKYPNPYNWAGFVIFN